MEYSWETFQTAYQAAAPEQKATVDDGAIPLCVRTVLESKQVDSTLSRQIIRLYSLYALGAANEQSVVSELEALKVAESKEVLAAIKSCVVSTQTTLGPTATGLGTVPTEAESATGSVPGMRTMAEDMSGEGGDNIPTYTSTQEAILKEGRSTPEDSDARWGQ